MPPEEIPFSERLLGIIAAMPEGGGYRFTPGARAVDSPSNPRDPTYDGVLSDLSVAGETVAHAADDGATYCCGVTLEAFWGAWRAHCGEPPTAEAADAESLLIDWFCPTIGHAGAVEAATVRGLARRVSRDEARPGDLCQFWRRTQLESPSGHSVIFLGWGRAQDGQRTIRYWSSQPATSGIGRHEETVGQQWEIHLARVTPW